MARTLLAVLIVLLLLVAARAVQYSYEYGNVDLRKLPHASLAQYQANATFRTGDLILFNYPVLGTWARFVALTPFSHSGVVLMEGGVPHVCEVNYYWIAGGRRRGTTIVPLDVRLRTYRGHLFHVPRAQAPSAESAGALKRLARNGADFYAIDPRRFVNKPNYHCYEYVVHLLSSSGMIPPPYPSRWMAGKYLANLALWGGGGLYARPVRLTRG